MVRWNSWHKFTDRIAQQQRFGKCSTTAAPIRTMHSIGEAVVHERDDDFWEHGRRRDVRGRR